MTDSRRTDDGMTLIELLVSVLLLAIVITPVAMVVSYSFATARAESQRTTDSSGAQLLSSYLAGDVQSADAVWAAGASALSNSCATSNTSLEVQWTETADPYGGPTPSLTDVTYDVVPPGSADDDYQFRRNVWTGGNCTTPSDTETLVQAVDNNNLPTVTCTPSDCANANDVTLVVNALGRKVHNSNVYAPYTFTLTATRRVG